MLIDPQFLTVAEFAQIVRLSHPTIYRLVDSGKIDAVHIGGTIRIPARVLVKYLIEAGMEDVLEETGLASEPKPVRVQAEPAEEVKAAVLALAAHLPDVLSRRHKTVVSLIAVWSDGTTTALPVAQAKAQMQRQQNGTNPGGALAVPFMAPPMATEGP